ncbi:MAG: type 4a pilus biogenesis protein PilO [Patescibacteria group bacterium]
MKALIPIFSIAIAIGLFSWYIDPAYARIETLREEEATYDAALDRSRELQEVRDQLLSRYNTFSAVDVARLEKLLPDHVDNVRLILDLDSTASKYGMRVRNVAIDDQDKKKNSTDTLGPDEVGHESLVLSFTVSGQYSTFRQFMADLEKSLRLVDVVGLTFSTSDTGIYDFTVSINTYWLKP